MRSRKMYVLVAIISSTAITSIAISALFIYNNSSESEPIPIIAMRYDDQETAGSLQGYRWQGSYVQPHTQFDPPVGPLNMSNGEIMEFISNSDKQPSYYVVTLVELTEDEDEVVILEDVRLDKNQLVANFRESSEYVLSVTAIWVRIDLFGQEEDAVTYAYLINIISG